MIPLSLSFVLLLSATPAEEKQLTLTAMHAAMRAVTSLQPYLASPEAFQDPANATIVAAQLDALAGLKHRFMGPGKQDPSVETLAGLFGDSVVRAQAEMKKGNTDVARMRLRSVTGLCFACHSRQAASKDFEDLTKSVDALDLPPLRKAEFFATTRQFEKAAALWSQALTATAKSEAEWFEHAGALRQYLAVLVRVKDDRDATMRVLAKQSARKELPVFFKRMVDAWLVEATAWKADDFAASRAAPAALFARAKKLIDGTGAGKTVIWDDARFVSLLRASGYLHTALEKDPRALWRGEALYLLAIATSASMDPLLWDLDDLYLEACIREKPHSAIAAACSERMYDRAWFGWSGSGGTRIPPDVTRRLGELRQLAQ